MVIPVDRQQNRRIRGRRQEKTFVAGHVCAASLFSRSLRESDESKLRLKAFAGNLLSRVSALIKWNKLLTSRLQAQVEQLDRLNRLRKFLSPQVAEVVISNDQELTPSCRREISALFCDLRGFTALSDNAPPEAVLDVLRVYHQAMGEQIDEFNGTIEHRAGDGIMVMFNAPLPCKDPAMEAVRLAIAMRTRMRGLTREWRKLGYELGFGVGVSLGYATLTTVGSEGRLDYVANGRAVNLASRLCDEATDGQILLSEPAYGAVKERVETDCVGDLTLKGFGHPVKAFDVVGLSRRDSSARRPEGYQDHARDNQESAPQLKWSQWLPEEEIRSD